MLFDGPIVAKPLNSPKRTERMPFTAAEIAKAIGGEVVGNPELVLTGFFEDRWFDESFVFSRYSPVAFATRAVKPPLESAR